MPFTTTITRENWEKKVKHFELFKYFFEYKEMSKHWNDRIPDLKLPCPGVFLVGREIHRVEVLARLTVETQLLSKDDKRYIRTDNCYALKCRIVNETTGVN
jgi:hypothetical protein